MYPKLFERGKIGRLEIGNRIVKACTGTYLSNPDNSVTDRQVRFYEEMTQGGAGLVFVDNALVLKEHHMGICAASDEYIPGLSLLASTISDHGAKSGLQICHPGRDGVFVGASGAKAASSLQWEPWYEHGFAVPQELTLEEIHELVKAFGNAAKRAQMAGFDLVEVLAGFGTLPTNFLSPGQNKRNDMYGGSLHNRMRFLVEIVRDIRNKVGPNYPLGVRMALIDYEPDGIVLEESIEVAKALEMNGVDVINAAGGSHAEAIHGAATMLMPLGLHVPAVAALKKEIRIPVMVAGSIPTPELAEEILASGKADFIALGRPLLADPQWPKKAKEGRPEDIRPCIRCNDGCHDRGIMANRIVKG
jgi:2,4-dienoyl-CoA reductase-like NADH-dependent reductase (Old Yellow Enzyme family)